ncbi:MAG: HAMP domain-containing histidine kinase [Rubrobacter sp.]|nr:HAMP domain-containing histidine kinase [Rubrobacter sp.]
MRKAKDNKHEGPVSGPASGGAQVPNPWRTTLGAVIGMIVAIIIVGIVGLWLNNNITSAADEALTYDVELEDHGDDMRVAVLEVRHHQRNLYFGEDPTRAGTANFENAFLLLEEEIDEYDDLDVREGDITTPEEFREMSETYYDDYYPAIGEFARTGDRSEWDYANDVGLARLDQMQEMAGDIDDVGEELSEVSLTRVNEVSRTGSVILAIVIAGLVVAGVILAYSTVRVVNELRRLNVEQELAARKLAEASKAKTDFLADVSHELRTPLTVMRGNAEIGMHFETDSSQKEMLAEILSESDKMTKMVEDLLFLARSDSSSLPLDRGAISVATFLSTIAERADTLARERGSELRTNLSAQGIVDLDHARFEQAVMILVDNAAKYAGQRDPISLSTRISDGEFIVEVEDKGPGIPQRDLPHIFERFYRVDKTRSRKLGGSGLGLPIAKTIIEAHGGTLEAHSKPGEGTTMTIRLPIPEKEYIVAEDKAPPSKTRAFSG